MSEAPADQRTARAYVWNPATLRGCSPAWPVGSSAYLAEGRGKGAFWRASVQGRALLLSAVQLDQAAALRVAGEFTI